MFIKIALFFPTIEEKYSR